MKTDENCTADNNIVTDEDRLQWFKQLLQKECTLLSKKSRFSGVENLEKEGIVGADSEPYSFDRQGGFQCGDLM